MKNLIRKWLGLPEDYRAIADDIGRLHEALEGTGRQLFEVFHAMAFSPGILKLTAKDAATFTTKTMTPANSAIAILTGIVMAARQGQSYLQVTGELPAETRSMLEARGFVIQEFQGTESSGLNILWT